MLLIIAITLFQWCLQYRGSYLIFSCTRCLYLDLLCNWKLCVEFLESSSRVFPSCFNKRCMAKRGAVYLSPVMRHSVEQCWGSGWDFFKPLQASLGCCCYSLILLAVLNFEAHWPLNWVFWGPTSIILEVFFVSFICFFFSIWGGGGWACDEVTGQQLRPQFSSGCLLWYIG